MIMGSGSSVVAVTRQGLYPENKYRWSVQELGRAIGAGKLAPIERGQKAATSTHKAECQICYQFYPSVNKTSCCGQFICSECLTVVSGPPPLNNMCPFCRRSNPTTQIVSGEAAISADDQAYRDYEERRRMGLEDKHLVAHTPELSSEEEERLRRLVERTHLPEVTLREVIAAGLTDEEILENMQ